MYFAEAGLRLPTGRAVYTDFIDYSYSYSWFCVYWNASLRDVGHHITKLVSAIKSPPTQTNADI